MYKIKKNIHSYKKKIIHRFLIGILIVRQQLINFEKLKWIHFTFAKPLS